MPTTIQGTQGPACAADCLKDTTPPPTPQLRHSMAFERGTQHARVLANNGGGGRGGAYDPAYIELGNVEAGTKFEIVNISKKPDATFEKDAIELEPTGRDLQNRTASIYLKKEDLDRLDLKAGDIYLIRAKDAAGNVSGFVRGELEPDDWANANVQDYVDNNWQIYRGRQTNMLDGEGAWKNVILRAINDQRAPVVLEDKLFIETRTFTAEEIEVAKALIAGMPDIKARTGADKFAKDQIAGLVADATLPQATRDALKACLNGDLLARFDDACWMDRKDGIVGIGDLQPVVASNGVRVALKGDFSMEPDARMTIQNQRSGKVYEGAVGADSVFAVVLDDMQPGDPLILKPVDHEGHAGQELRRTYAPKCDKGMAPVVNALGARLNGVI